MNPDGQDPLGGAQGAQVNAEVSLIVLYSTCECVGGLLWLILRKISFEFEFFLAIVLVY